MASVLVVGGGLAGLASAAALGGLKHEVNLYESRGFLGGRATSYPAPGGEEIIDNCQHILLRCCVNLQDFYRRLGVHDAIEFHREFYFLEPGGRMSKLAAGALPTPLHFTGSFLRSTYLNLAEKAALGRAIFALQRQRGRTDLDEITMLDWLHEQHQPPRVIERFWRQVLVSAINEELDRMAASHGFQVFWLGFLAQKNSYEMGVPRVPLAELYGVAGWQQLPNVRLHLRQSVTEIQVADGRVAAICVNGEPRTADYYVSALPYDRLRALAPALPLEIMGFGHSPITGIHLWFDRPVTELPHGTVLDSPLHWFFTKDQGRYLQLVISASRDMVRMSRGEIIQLAVDELKRFLPRVAEAQLVRAHVVKEVKATFSAVPGLEAQRPVSPTMWPNFFLAGDWTRSGWPATMEGAVRSGYLAAEAVTSAAGQPERLLLPDIG